LLNQKYNQKYRKLVIHKLDKDGFMQAKSPPYRLANERSDTCISDLFLLKVKGRKSGGRDAGDLKASRGSLYGSPLSYAERPRQRFRADL